MILNDETIKGMLYQLFDFYKSSATVGEIEEQINPNSIDLTLDRHIMRMNGHSTVVYGEDNSNCWKYHYDTVSFSTQPTASDAIRKRSVRGCSASF